eukprot:6212854-Pleurochrysis_carterae.AAC.2
MLVAGALGHARMSDMHQAGSHLPPHRAPGQRAQSERGGGTVPMDKNSADKLHRADRSADDDHANAPAGGVAGGARHASRQSRKVGCRRVEGGLAGNGLQAAEEKGRSAGGCACVSGARDQTKGIVVVSKSSDKDIRVRVRCLHEARMKAEAEEKGPHGAALTSALCGAHPHPVQCEGL